ncbi:MAG: hypothetical protein H7Z73_07500 [Candidatus Saccharibacteria bacterium]|nr:hypothetical protein [Moraxellaceae bacterium]
MTQMNQDDQDKLAELLEKSTKHAGTFDSADRDFALFKSKVMKDMSVAWVARPWIMCLLMFVYRVIVNFQERKLNALPRFANAARAAQEETVEKFRFAANFGRPANPTQRKWCLDQVHLYGITYFDAPFLVWSGTLQFKKEKIIFGKWDLISGIVSMFPLLLLIFIAYCTCLCDCLSPASKAISVTVYLAEIIFLFKFYKAQSFDVYKIGSKYFKANGWGFTPQ